MGITKTIHPPAGATALLCSTSPEVTVLGWFLLPLIILGSSLLLAVGCVVNNIQRQFPIYWWTPDDLSRKGKDDIERVPTGKGETYVAGSEAKIIIDAERIVIPDWLPLESEEREMLEILTIKLREGQGLENPRSKESETTEVHDPGENPDHA
jgi:hypothetical protein